MKNLTYKSENISANMYLYEAETIANAFSQALQYNNCLIMMPIGLHQDIKEEIKDIEELLENINNSNNNLYNNPYSNSFNNPSINEGGITPEDLKNIKDKCFNCDLKLPGLDVDFKMELDLSGLKVSIELFKSLPKLEKLDFCQASFAMKGQCIPDIIKLIILLLTVYTAIMGLKSLANFSLYAFIKGVISTILSKLLGSLNISINLGLTNIDCIISVLKEIALALPTEANILNRLDKQDERAELLNSTFFKNSAIDGLASSLNEAAETFKDVDKELEYIAEDIENSFGILSEVLDYAVESLGNYLNSLLSFKTVLGCESSRSGIGIKESFAIINKLITTLNMLSGVVLGLAKKEYRDKVCKSKGKINRLSEREIDDLLYKDTLQDFNKQLVDIIESDDNQIKVLIYEKEPAGLPKIDLFDCNMDEFISAHTLPNILEVAKREVEKELEETGRPDPAKYDGFSAIPTKLYTFKRESKDILEYIDNLVKMIYIPPTEGPNPTPNTPRSFTDPEVIKDIKQFETPLKGNNENSLNLRDFAQRTNNNDLKCKSIDDVINLLDSFNNR